MQVVNEQSTAYLTVEFKGKTGSPETPASIAYRIHDLATGTVLETVEAGVVIPASTVELTIEASVNRIVKPGKDKEAHCITITATYGDDAQQVSEFVFYVLALGAVT